MRTRKNTLLSSTIVGGLAASISVLAASGALAQDAAVVQDGTAAQDGSAQVEDIVVIGSRIRRDNYNAPSPTQVVTREEATLQGFASTTEALQSTAVTGGTSQINNA